MKPSKFFLMAAIALGLVACNNEEVGIDPNAPESTVSVRIAPSSDATTVRAVGNLSGNGVLAAGLTAESFIQTLEVYIFSGEAPDGYKKAEATGTSVTQVLDIATHSGARTIIVVANANIGAVANKAALLAKTKDLPVTAGQLVMTSGEASATLLQGDNQYGFSTTTANYDAAANQLSIDTPLPIVRINARVAITSVTLSLPTSEPFAPFDELKEVQVAMFNVPKASKLFGTSLATNAAYLYGVAWVSTADSYTVGTTEATFTDNITSLPITAASAPYYYVNENTSATAKERTFIVLRGKTYKAGELVVASGVYTDTDGYTYYPVWINANDKGYTYGGSHSADNKITRNTQYNISLTITKEGNPTIDPKEESNLDVQVEVKPWEVVTQTVTW